MDEATRKLIAELHGAALVIREQHEDATKLLDALVTVSGALHDDALARMERPLRSVS